MGTISSCFQINIIIISTFRGTLLNYTNSRRKHVYYFDLWHKIFFCTIIKLFFRENQDNKIAQSRILLENLSHSAR